MPGHVVEPPAGERRHSRGRLPRRRSHRTGPPRGVRTGYRWWAYVLLAVIAAATVALVATALLHDYGGAASSAIGTSADLAGLPRL